MKVYGRDTQGLGIFLRVSTIATLTLFLGSVGLAQSFTEPGGPVPFSTQDFQVYTTGVDGVGERSLNLTGNATGLSTVEEPVDVYFNISESGSSNWQKVDAGTISSESDFNAVVRNLEPGTDYDFSAYAESEPGSVDSVTTSTYDVNTGSSIPSGSNVMLTGGISNVNGFTGDIDDSIGLNIYYRKVGSSSWNTVNVRFSSENTGFATELAIDPSAKDYEFKAGTEDGFNGSIKSVTSSHPHSGGSTGFTTDDFSVVNNQALGTGARTIEMSAEAQSLSNLDSPIEAYFEIREAGTSNSWERVDAGTIDSSESFSATAYNLDPGTDYEFRAFANSKSSSLSTATTNVYSIGTGVGYQSDGGTTLTGTISNVSSTTTASGDTIDVGFYYREVGSSSWNKVFPRSVDENTGFATKLGIDPSSTDYEFKASSGDGINGTIREVPEEHPVSGGVVSFATGPYFEVTVQDVNEPVIEGNDVEVEALVENTGADGSTTVDLNIPGLGSNSTTVDLNGGDFTTKTLSIPTSEGDSGEYTANFSSDNDFDTQSFNVSTLNPPVNPLPENDSEPVGLDWDLSAESNSSFKHSIDIYLVNDSGTDIPLGGNLSDPGERINKSLDDAGLETGTEYEWYANSTYNGQSAQSEVWNFTTVERPQVTLAEPHDESVDPNPVLNVTVDGNSPINVTVGESTGAGFERDFDNVDPGDTVQVDTSGISDFGEGPNEYWNVSLEAYGAEWDNSGDFYNFTVADLEGVDYSLQDISSGDNLNPGNFGDLKVYGENEIAFQVDSSPSGASDMNFRINVTNGTDEKIENFGGVEDGEVISVDLSNIGLVNENSEGYGAEAYYLEGSTRLNSDFESNTIDFSTHVAEVEFTHPGDNVDEFRVLYNATSNSSYSQVASVPIEDVSSDQNDLYQIGVANPGLKDNSESDCYQVEAWNRFGGEKAGYQDGGDQCLGDENP